MERLSRATVARTSIIAQWNQAKAGFAIRIPPMARTVPFNNIRGHTVISWLVVYAVQLTRTILTVHIVPVRLTIAGMKNIELAEYC